MSAPPDRLTRLAERYGVPPAGTEALARLLEVLEADPEAPTTVRSPTEAVDRHVADSLVATELAEVRAATSIADLGSGAGPPGIVLAAALPAARVRLVESASRKCAFLGRAVEHMGLENVEVVCARAEEWQAGLRAHDLVTARALAPLAVVLEYAAPLLRGDACVVAWKGHVEAAEARSAVAAGRELGLERIAVRPVEPWIGAERTTLHVYRKVRPTPARFPRRAGMARKRPLGGST